MPSIYSVTIHRYFSCIQIMKELLSAKAEQCKEFSNCLMENKDHLLAEATPSKFWGTGMSLFVTKNCSPRYWLGRNMLGALLSELTQELLRNDGEVDGEMNVVENAEDGGGNDNQMDISNAVEIHESDNDDNDVEDDVEDEEFFSDDQCARSREHSPVKLSNTTTTTTVMSTATSNTTTATSNTTTGNNKTPVTNVQKSSRSNKPNSKPKKKPNNKPIIKPGNKPGSNKTSNTKKSDKSDKSKKPNKEQCMTPLQDIRTVIQEVAKRKTMDSSPDGVSANEPKVQKQNDEVG